MTESNTQTEKSIELIDSAIEALNIEDSRALSEILTSLKPPRSPTCWNPFPTPDAVTSGSMCRMSPLARCWPTWAKWPGVHLLRVSIGWMWYMPPLPSRRRILQETLPEELGDAIRESLDFHGLRRLDATLAFAEGSAGRLMDTEAVSVRADVRLETVLRYLRRRESLPDHTVGLMVVPDPDPDYPRTCPR